LLDGEGNSSVILKSAVDLIVNFVHGRQRILVACSGGMSRSPLIASAVVAKIENIDFDEAIQQVTRTGPCDISPALYVAIKKLVQ